MGAVSFRPGQRPRFHSEGEKISYVAGDMFGDLDGDKHLDLVIVSARRIPLPGRLVSGSCAAMEGAFKENSSSSLPILAEPRFVRLADVNGTFGWTLLSATAVINSAFY